MYFQRFRPETDHRSLYLYCFNIYNVPDFRFYNNVRGSYYNNDISIHQIETGEISRIVVKSQKEQLLMSQSFDRSFDRTIVLLD